MPTVQDILQFHFSSIVFQQSAQNVIPNSLKLLNEHRIGELQKIIEQVGANPFPEPPNNLIPQVFRKFKKSINKNDIIFERRELRTLTYSLNFSEQDLLPIFFEETELKYALILLESNWKDSFLFGLVDCFLKNWETKHRKSLEQLEQFINRKFDSYLGNRKALISFKNNKRYFNSKNGNLILGDTIAKLNKPIQEATNILGVPESWFSYSYFSKVIITYYERNRSQLSIEIDNLNEVLLKHKSSVTNKRLISKIIIQANLPEFVTLQDSVKKIAFTQIGDPSNFSTWTIFENATEIERREIVEAKNILDEWIAKQFIDVFFRVCINDKRRKEFWLKIVSKNRVTFRVYGPSHIKNRLRQEKKISEYLDARFQTVSSNRDISAFILYIGNYILIEFSDAGYAFYAYKVDGKNKPNLDYNIESVDALRNGNMHMLIYRSGYTINSTNKEGRLSHNDGELTWEEVFEYWFKNVASINV